MDPLQALQACAFFQGLDSRALERLAAHAGELRRDDGERVFSAGDPGDSMYVVVSGLIEISRGTGEDRVVFDVFRAGGVFGELSILDGKPRAASAVARMPTVLLEIRRERFLGDVVANPAAALQVMIQLAEHVRGTTTQLATRTSRNTVRDVEEQRTWSERLADNVAQLNGSWAFIGGLFGLCAAWMLLNLALRAPFDPYPFVFFNLLLGVLVAMQGPVIMMSQNRQAEKDRARAANDYLVNLKNELAIDKLIREVAALRIDLDRRG